MTRDIPEVATERPIVQNPLQSLWAAVMQRAIDDLRNFRRTGSHFCYISHDDHDSATRFLFSNAPEWKRRRSLALDILGIKEQAIHQRLDRARMFDGR